MAAVAESEAASASAPVPRYEPSWMYDAVPEEMIAHSMRPPTSAGLDADVSEWCRKRLVHHGHAANARGHHHMAYAWFSCAYGLSMSATDLLSAINMRLRLGQCTLAARLYGCVLSCDDITDAQREVAQRKLAEAEVMAAARTREPQLVPVDDEVAQLLAPLPAPPDSARLVRLLRRSGHAANRARDFEAAALWFDCTYAASQQLADLLSTANMRLKLAERSPAAAALYAFALSEPHANEREVEMAARKLGLITAAPAAAA